jgi:glycosyltransferase involved in cell wall biosynthesis
MASAVPCVSSTRAGVTADLIEEGVTGFAMDFSRVDEAAAKVVWLLANAEEAEKVGRNGQAFIERNVTLEQSAAGFIEAIRKAT